MKNVRVADRVKETSLTIGTGDFTLNGALSSYQTFVSAIGAGNYTYYTIVNDAKGEWETGYGHVLDSPARLVRTIVYQSSNSNSLVNFSPGRKDVFVSLPATKAILLEPNNPILHISGGLTLTGSMSINAGTGSFEPEVNIAGHKIRRELAGNQRDLQIWHRDASGSQPSIKIATGAGTMIFAHSNESNAISIFQPYESASLASQVLVVAGPAQTVDILAVHTSSISGVPNGDAVAGVNAQGVLYGTGLYSKMHRGNGTWFLQCVSLDNDTTIAGIRSTGGFVGFGLQIIGSGSLTGGLSAAGLSSTQNVYINDSSNTKSTLGLTINQGAADDEILSLKSSDISHGVTSLSETDTYAAFNKVSATVGGLDVYGFAETAGTYGIRLTGVAGTENTTQTTSGLGCITIVAAKSSGSAVTSFGSNANILVIRNNTSTKFIFNADGQFFYNGLSPSAYDEYDDLALVRTLDLNRNAKGVVKSKWDEFINTNKTQLEDLGIISDGGFVDLTRHTQLLNGAIWQMYTKHMDHVEMTDDRIRRLESKLNQLEEENKSLKLLLSK